MNIGMSKLLGNHHRSADRFNSSGGIITGTKPAGDPLL